MEPEEKTPPQEEKPKRGRPPGSKTRRPPPVIREPEAPPPPYRDPIEVWVTMKNGDEGNFFCKDYDLSGPVWKFKSFPPERGRETLRLINPSEIALLRIEEPEGWSSPQPTLPAWTPPPPSNAAYPPGYPQHTSGASYGPPVQPYVAKDHLARRAEGGLVRGVPQSVILGDNGQPQTVGAAMLPGGIATGENV